MHFHAASTGPLLVLPRGFEVRADPSSSAVKIAPHDFDLEQRAIQKLTVLNRTIVGFHFCAVQFGWHYTAYARDRWPPLPL